MKSDDALEDALVRTSFRVMAVLTRIGSENDLSLTQLRLLGLLRDRRPRMTELAAFLGLDKSTMSGLVERAERRGLVARGKSPDDRRVVDVFITPMGSELAERLQEEVRAALAPFTDRLRADDRHTLTELLSAVSGTAGATNAL
ncbi:DNA-binding transcriptional regulator, MarR family [Lentzea albidocapillata subsp. violacea]|uniref:DNA-binding transcriptional regulator, MarR family n=1 Tax=Lentzea albidocapillata subsp. violacea TaxID=128104 RepID=A0A1G9XEW9_9PSEU|nr:MarR family transcriptional regulator [Lentzea albidocapillata]SDM95278.1 DNA-binding transcriptional regulator, MarR family [Lentzea albidocapillata subsp. violacea]